MNEELPVMKRLFAGDSELAALVAQFARYGVVGVFVTALGVAAYWILATPVGIAPLLANFCAYLVAVAVGYVSHSRFSFRGHGSRNNLARTGGRFVVVSILSLGLNSLWVWTGTGLLHGPTWWPIPAMVFITPVVVFILNRKWVFG